MSHSTESLFEFEFGKSYKKHSASRESTHSTSKQQRKDSGYSLNNHLYHPHALPSPISSPNEMNINVLTKNKQQQQQQYVIDNTPSACSPKSPKSPLSLSQSKSEQFDYLYSDRPTTAKSADASRNNRNNKYKRRNNGNPFAKKRENSDDSVQNHRSHKRHKGKNKNPFSRKVKNNGNNNGSRKRHKAGNPFVKSSNNHGDRDRNNNDVVIDGPWNDEDFYDYNDKIMIKPTLGKTQSNSIKSARDSINGLAKRMGRRSGKKKESTKSTKSTKSMRSNNKKDRSSSKHQHRKTHSDVGLIINNLNQSTTQKLKDRVRSSKKKYIKSRTKSPRISNQEKEKEKEKKSRKKDKKKLKKKQKRIAEDDGKINKNRRKIKKLKRINPKKMKKRRKSNNDSDQLSMLIQTNNELTNKHKHY